jgi:hypothetical protein
MPASDEELRAAALAQLTTAQLRFCIVYLASEPITGGTRLTFPRITLEMPWDGFLVFVDLDPMANWTHACRYMCIRRETGEVTTVDARVPPFGARTEPSLHWRELYRASDVPADVSTASHTRRSTRE